ncbi:Uncharacterised protein [Klebsiella pneumoniae]|nr:Uncharacterised protein [Klebsiella pneumoniae]
MLVVQEGIGVLFTEVKINTANHHVHCSQTPGGRVGLLPVNGDITFLLSRVVMLFISMRFNKAIAGNEEATGTQRRVINTSIAFSQCELTKEVFVDVAENIFALQIELHAVILRFAETSIGKNVNQAD